VIPPGAGDIVLLNLEDAHRKSPLTIGNLPGPTATLGDPSWGPFPTVQGALDYCVAAENPRKRKEKRASPIDEARSDPKYVALGRLPNGIFLRRKRLCR
jgi:hypothetical protein